MKLIAKLVVVSLVLLAFTARAQQSDSVYMRANYEKFEYSIPMRVGVVGKGSSGVQMITIIAKQAGHMTVFKRTANLSMPARNGERTSYV
jgi:hypothetical protein